MVMANRKERKQKADELRKKMAQELSDIFVKKGNDLLQNNPSMDEETVVKVSFVTAKMFTKEKIKKNPLQAHLWRTAWNIFYRKVTGKEGENGKIRRP